jgi:hypothetical protein
MSQLDDFEEKINIALARVRLALSHGNEAAEPQPIAELVGGGNTNLQKENELLKSKLEHLIISHSEDLDVLQKLLSELESLLGENDD